ncbi:DUF1616 domain-containing protein [Methanobacterium petrolearium]|uniref:DUF1616 domain-containing protein n=1 Tax=Methanobacterium petrolearium TaxID=710190 RepID=UPI001AE63697|nr:DUF1616 domain-containing protein [Methanobacterium petrolearium]MBP1945488.1 putative membrane protein [Methanobacterium petrolearium]BDZ71696.1 hypothetical protein GCM10025861_22130 [Methanobacterium petrolearium]
MKLSYQKDLLLVIIISLTVLTMSWLRLITSDLLTFIQYVSILLLPGYALMTAIWPTDEKIGWSMRAGVGFVLGLFFVLFLPLIFNSFNIGYLSGNLTNIFLCMSVLLSLIAMARRTEPFEDEPPAEGVQLTLEESIQRAADMRHRVVEEHEDEYDEEYSEEEYPGESEYYDEDYEDEDYEDEDYEDEDYEDEEVSDEPIERYDETPYDEESSEDEEEIEESEEEYEDLKGEKPLQYKRMQERGYLDEDPHEDERHESVPFRVEEPIKTELSPTEYEEEIDRPFWMEENVQKKPGFKNWDQLIIIFSCGISLFFLYFNPLNNTISTTIFFIILLFTLGYEGLTIIFPDKSRVTSNKIIPASVITAIILFTISFLAWSSGFLPDVPKYLTQILFVATIIILAGAFIRKLRKRDAIEEYEEEISAEPIPSEEIQTEEPGKEEVHDAAERPPLKSDEKTDEKSAEKSAPAKKTVEIVDDKKVHKEPPTYKPRNYYTDIILIVALTLFTAAFVLIPPLNKTFIRTILGILLVLFIPGYSLIAALFPKWGDLDGIERTALSFGLSIAVTPLIGLGLNYTPWGIRLDPILISLTIFTIAMCIIAYLRRSRLHEQERFFVPIAGFIRKAKGSFKSESKTEKILSVILILSIVLAISTTAYIIVKPKEGEKFTEFYILGPNGTASDYPTNLTAGQNGSVIIGVVNHEYATKDYQVVVTVNNRTLKNETITLNNSQKVEIPFNFTTGTAGEKKMEFSLYKLPDQDTVYRSLHLWLNITG